MLTLLRQLWHIAGFARQGCRTNWLFGIDGGNQKERPFSSCPFFTCSDGRIKSFDVCCLLILCWFVNKNTLFTRLQTAVWKQATFRMLIWVRVFRSCMFSNKMIVDWWKLLATGMRKQQKGHLGHFSYSDQLNVVIFIIDHPTLGGKSMLEFLPPTKIEVTTRKGPFQKTVSFSNHWFFKGYVSFQGSKSRYIRSSVLPSNFIN